MSFKDLAKERNITLKIVSNFRSFEDQLSIWNSKAKGEKTLLDDEGQTLSYEDLTQEEVLAAILRWSALPGLSRHHWGTDCDIIDKRALNAWLIENPNYKVELTPWEYGPEGPFSALGDFLNEELLNSNFFRPYEKDRGGVANEPWHLSHISSVDLMDEYSYDAFKEFLESSYMKDLKLLDLVKKKSQWIYENFFLNITGPQ